MMNSSDAREAAAVRRLAVVWAIRRRLRVMFGPARFVPKAYGAAIALEHSSGASGVG